MIPVTTEDSQICYKIVFAMLQIFVQCLYHNPFLKTSYAATIYTISWTSFSELTYVGCNMEKKLEYRFYDKLFKPATVDKNLEFPVNKNENSSSQKLLL